MNKLERLLNLTAALLATSRPLTASDIRERVPGYPEADASFRRAFERDKDDLREMGIPVTVRRVGDTDPPIDGYLVPKDKYYLPDPDLAADELAALHLAANAVRVDGLHGMEAFWKLGGVVAGDGEQLDAPELASLPADTRLALMFTAVLDRRSVAFDYNDEARLVDPHRLDFNRGRWYLTGYDHAREGTRNFRFDRIEGEVTIAGDEQFERPAEGEERGAQRQPWELGGEAAVSARLLIDPDQAAWAVRHLGEDLIEEFRSDGSVVAGLEVTNRQAFRSFVLTFLEHAEVLDPPELRADVVSWLEALAR